MKFCDSATQSVDMSGNGTNVKTYCSDKATWTNCEQLGRCTISDGPHVENQGQQLALFDVEGLVG